MRRAFFVGGVGVGAGLLIIDKVNRHYLINGESPIISAVVYNRHRFSSGSFDGSGFMLLPS